MPDFGDRSVLNFLRNIRRKLVCLRFEYHLTEVFPHKITQRTPQNVPFEKGMRSLNLVKQRIKCIVAIFFENHPNTTDELFHRIQSSRKGKRDLTPDERTKHSNVPDHKQIYH